jgi:hypothetical protein
MSLNLNAIKYEAENLRSIGFAAIAATYAATGPIGGANAPLLHPAVQIKVDNFTNTLMAFSFDGINDHFVLNSGQSLIDDINSNRSNPNAKGLYMHKGDALWVRYLAAPASGSVYFSVFYASDV